MSYRTILSWMMTVAITCALGSNALATRHIVGPGQDWSKLSGRVRPGDEIVLMPGQHRPVHLIDLKGTPTQPITIRSYLKDRPAYINPFETGIILTRPRSVIIKDLYIIGAKKYAILVEDDEITSDEDQQLEVNSYRASNLQIINLTIKHTGPDADGGAMRFEGVEGLFIEDCTIEAWGGIGIDVVGCRNVVISRCILKGDQDFVQKAGISLQAGTTNVDILSCSITKAGNVAIRVGGSALDKSFRPPLSNEDKATVRYQANDVTIASSLVVGSDTSIEITDAKQVFVRQCTFSDPAFNIFLITRYSDKQQIGSTSGVFIAGNLIVWEKSQNVGSFRFNGLAMIDRSVVRLEDNLWFREGLDEASLGKLPFDPVRDQLLNVDPDLDERYRPQNEKASRFGHWAGLSVDPFLR